MSKTPRILVTGRTGQLASSLGERALSMPGMELVFAGRPELDLERPQNIAPLVARISPDVIVSAAAYTNVDQAEDEPELVRTINAEAPETLAVAARKAGARMIHVSTDYVHDGCKPSHYVEDDPPAPQGVYGRTKREGEERVLRADPRHAVVRTAWVYSPFGHNFVKTMLALARTRPTVSVVEDQRGSPTSALDLADGLLCMIARWHAEPEAGGGRLYNLAGSGEASRKAFAERIFAESRAAGGPWTEVAGISSSQWQAKAARPANSVLDSRRFEQDFGYRAPDWRKSIGPVVRRLLQQAS